MYLIKAVTLEADSCHNLDLRQLSVIQSILMYQSVVEVKKIIGFSFSKLSFKVASACMLPQGSDICLQTRICMLWLYYGHGFA